LSDNTPNILNTIDKNETPVHKGEPIKIIRHYIKSELSFLSDKSKKLIEKNIPKKDTQLDDNEASELIIVIRKAVKDEDLIGSSIFGFVLAAIGIYYVYSSVFT